MAPLATMERDSIFYIIGTFGQANAWKNLKATNNSYKIQQKELRAFIVPTVFCWYHDSCFIKTAGTGHNTRQLGNQYNIDVVPHFRCSPGKWVHLVLCYSRQPHKVSIDHMNDIEYYVWNKTVLILQSRQITWDICDHFGKCRLLIRINKIHVL